MGKPSQSKGARGEAELRDLLRAEGYSDVERGGYCYGEKPDLYGLPHIHVEVKRVERLNVPEAMRQAAHDAEKFQDGLPAVFHRRSREPWLVTMCFRDWMELYRAYNGEKWGEGGRLPHVEG